MYTANYFVDYISLRQDFTSSFSRLMSYVLETSLYHTESTPHTMEWLKDNGFVWVITSWQIELYKSPKWHEKIEVRTSPIEFRGIIGDRLFEVYGNDGECYLRANSRWTFVDFNKKRPVKPKIEFLEPYYPCENSKLELDFNIDGNLEEDYTLNSEAVFPVGRRDIDTNTHVNNLRYIDWAFDQIPETLFFESTPKLVKVHYKKECFYGDKVCVKSYISKSDDKMFWVKIFQVAEDGSEVLASEVFSVWN